MMRQAFDIAINGEKLMEKVNPAIMPVVVKGFFNEFTDENLSVTISRVVYNDGTPEGLAPAEGGEPNIEKAEGEEVAPENVVPMQPQA